MDFSSLGTQPTDTRDTGVCIQYTFPIPNVEVENSLRSLLILIPIGSELSVADPTGGECWLEAKRTAQGDEIKRGCHGAHGTWQTANWEQTISWLAPGFLAATMSLQMKRFAFIEIPKGKQT